MRRVFMTAVAIATFGIGFTSPAQAVILQQCTSGASCVSGTTNVNLTDQNAPGALTVHGTVGIGGPAVNFTSTNGLIEADSGAATIFRDNNKVNLLSQLTFQLLTGAFTKAEFNLEKGDTINSDLPLVITLTTSTGGTRTFNVNAPTGSNVFDIIAEGSETFVSGSFSTTNGGFQTFKQLRLVLAPGSVPEPATWAMMLLGFGGIGLTVRRSKRSDALMQIA